MFFDDNFIGLFTTDKDVIKIGTEALIWISLGYIFFGFGMVVSQAFNGAGDTRTPTILNLIGYWLIQIPLAWILAVWMNIGMIGIYLTTVIVSFVIVILSVYLLKKGEWKKVVV